MCADIPGILMWVLGIKPRSCGYKVDTSATNLSRSVVEFLHFTFVMIWSEIPVARVFGLFSLREVAVGSIGANCQKPYLPGPTSIPHWQNLTRSSRKESGNVPDQLPASFVGTSKRKDRA